MDAKSHGVFEALAMCEAQAIKSLDLSSFDWRSASSEFGTPLHSILFGRIGHDENEEEDEESEEEEDEEVNDGYDDIVSRSAEDNTAMFELLEFAMQRGADPHQVAPPQCEKKRTWGEDQHQIPVRFAGRSALQCLLATKRSLRNQEQEGTRSWSRELFAISEAIIVLSSPVSAPSTTLVHDDVVATWEEVLKAAAVSGDVAVCTDGADASEVRSDSSVLSAASPVVRAMLATASMRERQQKRVQLTDCSTKSAKLLLALVYTGTVSDTEAHANDVASMLCALELAHRWQVGHAVQALASAIGRHMDVHTFEEAADAALRLKLPELLTACQRFAQDHSTEMRGRISASRGEPQAFRSDAVRVHVERLLGNNEGDLRQKRRRLSTW